MDVDIPQLSSDGIRLDDTGFFCVYSIQSSSSASSFPLSFDASGLESFLRRHLHMENRS